MPRVFKRVITLLFDSLFVALALLGSLYIRVGEEWVTWYTFEVNYVLAILVVCSLAVWIRLGLYRAIIRYIDIKMLTTIVWGSLTSVCLLIMLLFTLKVNMPRSVPFIYSSLILIFVAGSRLVVRGFIQSRQSSGQINVMIYGAGASGRQLNLALQSGQEYNPVCFVDDDKQLQGSSIAGIKVYSPTPMEELIEKYHIKKILFAIPSATIERRNEIYRKLQPYRIEVLTIPGSADLVGGKAEINQLRNLEIHDLLGRDIVPPKESLLFKCVKGKNVMVSGAGGSIGSELCRTICSLQPSLLVLFDISEFNLYSIENELKDKYPALKLVPLLGNVKDKHLIDKALQNFQINTVYHAAAYKHVPIVEFNCTQGIMNNVMGTKILIESAEEHKVENFVLISTDKAVRPTNVMGASKRLAELFVQDIAARSSFTKFSMVRFGNVLGSSGSVVPLFKKQIESGGPITVTHPEITRFFMTIPEAASLVIQAGAMANGGEVFVLDMGSPIKIRDLAENMINLMGMTVKDEKNENGDIEIRYSGLRPGEKLYEELLIGQGRVEATQHPRIMKAQEICLAAQDLIKLNDNLLKACSSNDIQQLRELLVEAGLGYNPLSEIADLTYLNDAKYSKKVTSFQQKLTN